MAVMSLTRLVTLFRLPVVVVFEPVETVSTMHFVAAGLKQDGVSVIENRLS